MFIEFQDLTYSVVEDEEIYNVTIVKRGEPGEDIQVLILPNPDPTSANSAACKRTAILLTIALQFLYYESYSYIRL